MSDGWGILAVLVFYIILLLYCFKFIVKCVEGRNIGPAILVVVGIGLSAAWTMHVLQKYAPDGYGRVEEAATSAPARVAEAAHPAPVAATQGAVVSPNITVNVTNGDWTLPLVALLGVAIFCGAIIIIAFMLIRFRMWSQMQEVERQREYRAQPLQPLSALPPDTKRPRALPRRRE